MPAEKKNITLKLRTDVLRSARVMAAERELSVSELVTTLIQEAQHPRSGDQRAKWRARARLRKGYHLGFTPPKSRDEIYER